MPIAEDYRQKGRRVPALGASKIRLSFDKSCRCVAYDTITTLANP
jgi:hypothetical protein